MKAFKIFLLLLIPFLGFGQSEGVQANKAMAEYPAPAAAMETTFTAKSVNQSQVGTFQKRGIQKLKDFYNYLSIISNPTYDKKLREDAKNQARQLFYNSDCSVHGKTAAGFIDSCFNLQKQVNWKVENEEILQNMVTTAESDTGTYHGEVTFNESVNGAIIGTKRADIVLSRSEKQFGDSKREVWSIYICSIE